MNISISMHQRLKLSRACSRALKSYIETHSIVKLQLGTGANLLNEWFNTDIAPSSDVFFLDSTKHFPFENATFHYIFSEHHLEHLTYEEGFLTLRECLRVLKPEGKIRIATPSLETLISLYTPTPNDLQLRYIQFITNMFLPEVQSFNPAFVINNAFHNWGHKFLYDRLTLKKAMEEVGFLAINSTIPGESSDEQLRGIEKHGQFIGNDEINEFETMVLEGKRP